MSKKIRTVKRENRENIIEFANEFNVSMKMQLCNNKICCVAKVDQYFCKVEIEGYLLDYSVYLSIHDNNKFLIFYSNDTGYTNNTTFAINCDTFKTTEEIEKFRIYTDDLKLICIVK